MLLYVKNTTGNVFKDLNDQQNYVLVTGRWFRAPELTGPWQYVAGTSCRRDFTLIPDDSPKENVKAVGARDTTQAEEALIANGSAADGDRRPRQGEVHAADRRAPRLSPSPDTGLSYVFNSPDAHHPGRRRCSGTPCRRASGSPRRGAGGRGRSRRRCRRHLLDSGELAAPLRHLRADLRRHAARRGRGLHAGLYRHRGQRRTAWSCTARATPTRPTSARRSGFRRR